MHNKTQVSYVIELLKLVNTEDIEPEVSARIKRLNVTSDLTEIIELTQKIWLRPANKERWDLIDKPIYINKRNKIIRLLDKIGFVKEVHPRFKRYDAVLLHGISDLNLIDRINYIKKLWLSGVRFSKCFLLSGGITLNNRVSLFKNIMSSNEQIMTDSDLILYVYLKLMANSPTSLQQVEPIQVIAHNQQRRANTKDTLRTWIAKNETVTKVLIISNQPFIRYQHAVAKSVLDQQNYQFETVGDALNSKTLIAVMLDSLTRYLYESWQQG